MQQTRLPPHLVRSVIHAKPLWRREPGKAVVQGPPGMSASGNTSLAPTAQPCPFDPTDALAEALMPIVFGSEPLEPLECPATIR